MLEDLGLGPVLDEGVLCEDGPVTKRDFLELKMELREIKREMKELQTYTNNNRHTCLVPLSSPSSTSLFLTSPMKEQLYQNSEAIPSTSSGSSRMVHSEEAPNNSDPEANNMSYLSEDSPLNSRGETPIMVDLILSEIFNKLQFGDLKYCREVCKKWNVISSKEIRKRNTIEFNYNSGSSTRNPMLASSGKGTKMTKYISHFEKSKNFICEHFVFVNVPFGACITRKFFQACGHSIRRLSLSLKEQHINIEQFNELLSLQVPNLEILEIRDLPSSVTESAGFPTSPYTHLPFPRLRRLSIDYWNVFSKDFLSQIFSRAQNLAELNIGLLDEEYVDKVMAALLESANAEKLTHLSTDSLGREDFIPLVKLSKKKMKLMKLQITNMPDQACRAFLDFLEYQKETLEYLAFYNYGPKNLSGPLPKMPKLKNLEIAFNQPDISYGELSFAQQFPSLRLLEIEVGGFTDGGIRTEKWNEIFPSHVESPNPLKTVQELKFIRFEDPVMLKRVAALFPSVKKLRLELFSNEEEILKSLWTLWNDSLEELELEPSKIAIENVDSVFTGISPEDCNQILHEEAWDFVELDQIRCGPSICNLKKLRSLSIKYERNNRGNIRHNNLFSDITGFFALNLMLSLKEVSIEPSKMSEECITKCRARIPLFTVNARNFVC